MPPLTHDVPAPLNLARASGGALHSWRKSIGLNRPTFAGLGNFSERSLASYEKHKHIPSAARPQINEATRLIRALLEIIPKKNLSEWLETPNPGFQGEKPIKLIRRGERDVVWAMIHQTRQASFA